MATYSFSGAPVFVTVAATGVYDIDAFGAQGGNSSQYSTTGGLGAQEGGNFTLTAGEHLEIIVGGAGGAGHYGGGGGGGTFVLANTGAGGAFVPILVAGGGGGAYKTTGGAGTVGASGSGMGGSSTGYGAGGGGSGVKSDGMSPELGGYGGDNLGGAYAGGAGNSGGGKGGFGGGGGGGYSGGGGGGYTGGSDVVGHSGVGGTSFDSGAAIAAQTVAGARTGNGSLTITPAVACYLSGTLIRTDGGETAVETLAVGDRVVSWFGGTARVRGVEHRSLDASAHPRPWDVNPVRIKAGAFGARPSSFARSLRVCRRGADPDPASDQRCDDRAGARRADHLLACRTRPA